MVSNALLAQNEIKVTDPTIELIFEKPSEWNYYEDESQFYFIPPGKDSWEVMVVHYIESDNLDTYYEISLTHTFPRDEPNFKLLDRGDEDIGDKNVKWFKYSSNNKNKDYLNIAILFAQSNHLFRIVGTARTANFEKHYPTFISIVENLKSKEIVPK